MSHELGAQGSEDSTNDLSSKVEFSGGVHPLEQLDTLRHTTEDYPSFLKAPIDYEAAEKMLKEIDDESLDLGRLLTLFVSHRSSMTTESFNWGLLQQSIQEARQGKLPLSVQWPEVTWDEPFRYKPGLYLVSLDFHNATGRSIDQLRGELDRPAGSEVLSAIRLQKNQLAKLKLGNIAIAGLTQRTGQSTMVAPYVEVDRHGVSNVDAIYTDSELKQSVVPVVTRAGLVQKFEW